MIDQAEIVSSLAPLNGIHFDIPDLDEYAKKVASHGKCVALRDDQANELISYVLYYDDGPEIFVTMVWTHPEHQGQGIAAGLLRKLIRQSNKDINLEVHKDSPAVRLYESLGFAVTGKSGNTHRMSLRKKIAVMQPYVFPYLGYFHLVDASHLFVFYDDVHFVKKGWINRNRILLNGTDYLITVPVSKVSQNSLINETSLSAADEWKAKLSKTLAHGYRKAPFFSPVMDIIHTVFSAKYSSIADMAVNSVVSVYDYLGVELNYTRSSVCSPETKGMDKADRLIQISRSQGYKRYVNAAGGKDLYRKSHFSENGVDLSFVESEPVEYKQFANEFVPWLSIIDVMMFNDVEAIKKLFTRYKIR